MHEVVHLLEVFQDFLNVSYLWKELTERVLFPWRHAAKPIRRLTSVDEGAENKLEMTRKWSLAVIERGFHGSIQVDKFLAPF